MTYALESLHNSRPGRYTGGMSHTERLRRSPEAFRRLTGITPLVFDTPLAGTTPATNGPTPGARIGPTARASPGPGASTPSTWPTAC